MTFLAAIPLGHGAVDPDLLLSAAGNFEVTWFSPTEPWQGGVVSQSPMASIEKLQVGDRFDCVIAGRIRLDRGDELRIKLGDRLVEAGKDLSDAQLCLHAYARWGREFLDHIHGDFAFVIHDTIRRETLAVRDRFGVRPLALFRTLDTCWIAGSLHDLARIASATAGSLDPVWVEDFLQHGVSQDPSRTVYSAIRRLAPAHLARLSKAGMSISRYYKLHVDGPLTLGSSRAYTEAFHANLNAALRDRLPTDRVGIWMSGGLDSTTLAAKAVQLGGGGLAVYARTWLSGGRSDPEASASNRVALHLGLHHTVVDADRLRSDPAWWQKPASRMEPSLAILNPSRRIDEALAMRSQASRWLFGEGPDNALTFEWQMHLKWLWHNGQRAQLPGVVSQYLSTKSLPEWSLTLRKITGQRAQTQAMLAEHAWVRRVGAKPASEPMPRAWRPRADASFEFPLWPHVFEGLEDEYVPHGIEWCHPYMDLRVLEFLLATPPIPWARQKRLIRDAMSGFLPVETLRRPKVPLYRDIFAELLRQTLPDLPRRHHVIEPYVDVRKLPANPSAYPDVYALIRVAVLQHWLETRHA